MQIRVNANIHIFLCLCPDFLTQKAVYFMHSYTPSFLKNVNISTPMYRACPYSSWEPSRYSIRWRSQGSSNETPIVLKHSWLRIMPQCMLCGNTVYIPMYPQNRFLKIRVLCQKANALVILGRVAPPPAALWESARFPQGHWKLFREFLPPS